MKSIKHSLLLAATMMYLSVNAQEAEQYVKFGQAVAGISIAKGALVGYEKSISPKGTLSGIVSTHPLGKIVNKEKALFPVNVSLAYRNYYNIEKRKLNNKNIENNSANYFELRTSYTSDALVKNTKNNLNTSMFSVGGVFGIQRAFAERWSYHFNTGCFG